MPPIAAVAVTSQYMSTIPVAADGSPTGPCILWMDTRGAEHNLSLLTDESFMLFIERHGLIPLPSGNDNVAHVHSLQMHHPDSYERAAAFVEPMDYLNARLTGRVCVTQSTAFGQLVCDNRTWGATEYDPELVAATRLDPDKLAPLVPMNGIIGEVTSTAAAALGIAAGTPVTTGTIDSITSAVGSGALDAASGSVIIGTTSVMVTHIGEHRGDLGAGILAVPSPLPGMYYVMAENGVGGRAVEWAARLTGFGDDVASAVAAAAGVPTGADGVRFLPWLLGSIAPSPNDDVRAAWTGLSLQHDRRHLLRAVLEGVAAEPRLAPTRGRGVRRRTVAVPALRWWRRAERPVGAGARRRARSAGAPARRAAGHQRPWRGVPGLRRAGRTSPSPTSPACCRCTRCATPTPPPGR